MNTYEKVAGSNRTEGMNSGLSSLSSHAELGFLHAFYYHTLNQCATR
jgi:hypothetical protein